jgi:GTP cyclohydrolase I
MKMALRLENHFGLASGGGRAVSDDQVEDAFRAIIRRIGEDPDRDGLKDTPDRLRRAYREYFCGYQEDPEQVLRKTFTEVEGYDEMKVSARANARCSGSGLSFAGPGAMVGGGA